MGITLLGIVLILWGIPGTVLAILLIVTGAVLLLERYGAVK